MKKLQNHMIDGIENSNEAKKIPLIRFNKLNPLKHCTVQGCHKWHFAKGLCEPHYRAMRYRMKRENEK